MRTEKIVMEGVREYCEDMDKEDILRVAQVNAPKITICPPGPEPVRYTASCAEMGRLLLGNPNADLTIDHRRELWSNYNRSPRSMPVKNALLLLGQRGQK